MTYTKKELAEAIDWLDRTAPYNGPNDAVDKVIEAAKETLARMGDE